jgi:hypothetical protein
MLYAFDQRFNIKVVMEKRIVKLGGKLFVKKIWPKNAQFCSDQNL